MPHLRKGDRVEVVSISDSTASLGYIGLRGTITGVHTNQRAKGCVGWSINDRFYDVEFEKTRRGCAKSDGFWTEELKVLEG